MELKEPVRNAMLVSGLKKLRLLQRLTPFDGLVSH